MTYRLDHIALLVRDLDESVAFLTDVLGLTEGVNPMGGTHIRWIEIGDGRRFHVQAGDISKVHVEKQTHFALSATDFDAVLARFRAENIAFTDMAGTPGALNTRPDGMRAIFVRDPNGYWFEINDFRHPD
jgi:catechol 2,3-dioxygenase-like lactoylglutathione lyase family enzyme